jgi:hypothetical protein
LQLEDAVKLCETPIEDVKLALYRVRTKIWNSQYNEAMVLLLDVLRRQGYDPDYPEQLNLKVPRTLDEVETFCGALKEVPYDEESDVRILLATLMCESSCATLLLS